MDGTVSDAAIPADETAAPSLPQRFFSLSDRVGRLRYFTYLLGAMLGCSLLLLPIYLFAMLLPDVIARTIASGSIAIVTNVILPLVFFVMSIRRLHDLNASGWWSILLLPLPYAALILLALPGQRTANRFGSPPPANPRSVVLAAVALPAFLLALYLYLENYAVIVQPPTSKHPSPPAATSSLPAYGPD